MSDSRIGATAVDPKRAFDPGPCVRLFFVQRFGRLGHNVYLGGRLITPKQLSNAVLLVFALSALVWMGYDALDGSFMVCGRYGTGCDVRTYAGSGDYGYWVTVGFYLALPFALACLAWRGMRERARDRYK